MKLEISGIRRVARKRRLSFREFSDSRFHATTSRRRSIKNAGKMCVCVYDRTRRRVGKSATSERERRDRQKKKYTFYCRNEGERERTRFCLYREGRKEKTNGRGREASPSSSFFEFDDGDDFFLAYFMLFSPFIPFYVAARRCVCVRVCTRVRRHSSLVRAPRHPHPCADGSLFSMNVASLGGDIGWEGEVAPLSEFVGNCVGRRARPAHGSSLFLLFSPPRSFKVELCYRVHSSCCAARPLL